MIVDISGHCAGNKKRETIKSRSNVAFERKHWKYIQGVPQSKIAVLLWYQVKKLWNVNPFEPAHEIMVLITQATSEGSGESAQSRQSHRRS